MKLFSIVASVSLCGIVAFYALVNDTGSYSVYILPFYYLFILEVLIQLFSKFSQKPIHSGNHNIEY